MKICVKCLTVNHTNIVNRKYKGKYLESKTHQCVKCGSHTFYSGGINKCS